MNKTVDARDLSKLDLQVLTHNAKTKCVGCKNEIYIFNLKGAKQEMNAVLENKLIYEGLNEKGDFEASFAFECPLCERMNKVLLLFNLATRKETLIFDCNVSKMPVLKVFGGEK